MEPYKAYFQSSQSEFFAVVTNIQADDQGVCNIAFLNDKGQTGIVSLGEYKVTQVVPQNEQHFKSRLEKFLLANGAK